MQSRVSQRKKEIEAAFNRIEKAVAERRKILLQEIDGDSVQDGRGHQNKLSQLQLLVDALKDNEALAEEMAGCASDRDILQSADDLIRQCKTLSAMGVRTSEDKEVPSVKDMLMLDCDILLVTDNNNKALKALVPGHHDAATAGGGEGGGHKCLRLPLKTRPWGITLTQPNVVAVAGHQCLYIVTVTDQALSLQTTVRTRKDYWSIASLTPINIAGACKFPPSVDIVDITGRRLRTIEGEQKGITIFRQPYFLTSVNGNILLTDRQDHALICFDQAGQEKFIYKDSSSRSQNGSENGEEQWYMRGVCTDKQNRIFLVDGSSVFMISPQGDKLCQVLSGLPEPRAICMGRDNILAVSMDGRGVTFFKLCELKGPF